jgi:FkbM family methyltransferase
MNLPTYFCKKVGRRLEYWQRRLFSETLRKLGYSSHTVKVQGALFVVDTTDLIGRRLAWRGIWEGMQLELLADICARTKPDCFLDIGANIGVYSVMLIAKNLVPEIVAFEPDPGNYAHLLANLHVNGLVGKVKAYPIAVGSSAGEVTLMEAGPQNRGESWIVHADQPPEEAPGVATHTVKQIRFDDEFSYSGKTLVIKMDVEGSEFHALRGMERTLHDNRCYLQVELYSNRLEELKALFARLGYRFLHTYGIDHFFTNIQGLE